MSGGAPSQGRGRWASDSELHLENLLNEAKAGPLFALGSLPPAGSLSVLLCFNSRFSVLPDGELKRSAQEPPCSDTSSTATVT